MSKGKILLLAFALSMLLLLTAGGTLAYFTDTTAVRESGFAVGRMAVSLEESSGQEAVANVYPGQLLPKDPKVTNTGTVPCFVRIRVDGLEALGTGDDRIRCSTANVPDALGSNWFRHGDGLYYYDRLLLPGESTSALFEAILLPAALPVGAEGFRLEVQAQAAQAYGAADDLHTVTPEEIVAWFGVCMPAQ